VIEIITKEVKMPGLEHRRYQKSLAGNNWIVIDTQNNNTIRYYGNFENTSLACHNLNKKFYLESNDNS